MKLLNLSGTATKFIQLVAALYKLDELKPNFKPTDITAISGTSILVLPYLFKEWNNLFYEGENITKEDLFSFSPTNNDGKIRALAIGRALMSFVNTWNSFGVQNIQPYLDKYITEEMFYKYKYEDYPNVHIIAYDPTKGKLFIKNAKECSNLKELHNLIKSSSAIQVYTEHIEFEDENGKVDLVDGGMWCSGAGGYLMEIDYFNELPDEVISIYSFEEEPKLKENDAWKKNIFNNILRTSQGFKNANQWYSVKHEYRLCKSENISLIQLFTPTVLDVEDIYDVDKLSEAKNITLESIEKQLKKS
jgi:hypothetical protein